MKKHKKNPHIGSSFESYLEGRGKKNELYAAAIKRKMIRDVLSAIEQVGASKCEILKEANVARASFYRLMDPVKIQKTFLDLAKLGLVLKKRVSITFEDIGKP